MSLGVVVRQSPLAGRSAGSLMTGLAVVIAVLVAAPGSRSDRTSDYGVQTVYPLMLLPLIAVAVVAGLAVLLRPAIAQAAAVVSGLIGIQILGIAVVAARDWRNYAGADEASWERGDVGSLLAVVVFVAALALVLVSCAVYRGGLPAGEVPAASRAGLVAGLVVAAGLPVLLCLGLDLRRVVAAGQFAFWWSVPWAAGVVVACSAAVRAARRAAVLSVLVSVVITCGCAAASPLFGFGLRLPVG